MAYVLHFVKGYSNFHHSVTVKVCSEAESLSLKLPETCSSYPLGKYVVADYFSGDSMLSQGNHSKYTMVVREFIC